MNLAKRNKMTVLIILMGISAIGLFVGLALFGIGVAGADTTPMLTWGMVTINGEPAPYGTTIGVFVGNDTVSSGSGTVTSVGQYGAIQVWADESRYGESLVYNVGGQFADKLGPDEGVFGLKNQVVNLEIGHLSTTWSFSASGVFPKHLPDSYAGAIDLNTLTVPKEIQGIYRFDDSTLNWLFWADGAPGCTLSHLEGGKVADYIVATTGDCTWEIKLQ